MPVAGRAGSGLLVGAAMALPVLLLLPRRTRRLLAWPVGCWLAVAWVYLCIAWLPRRRSSDLEVAQFRADADVYIATSILGFHLAFVVIGFLQYRWHARRTGPSPTAHGLPRR